MVKTKILAPFLTTHLFACASEPSFYKHANEISFFQEAAEIAVRFESPVTLCN